MTELKDHVIIQQEGEDQMYTEDVLNIPAEENVGEEVDHLVVETHVRIIAFLESLKQLKVFIVHCNKNFLMYFSHRWISWRMRLWNVNPEMQNK